MYRMMFKSTKIILPLVILLLFTHKAYAQHWYAWYEQSSYYGVWATIKTPSPAQYAAPNSTQYHAVTTSAPHWMQAGWLYNYGDATPTRYYEYCARNCENDGSQYDLVKLESQTWGSEVKYEVSHESSMGSETWCAWIGGVRRFCKDNVRTPPVLVIIQSEIYTSPRTQIYTEFKSVRVKNSSETWIYPDLNNFNYIFPYKADRLTIESFLTYRIATNELFLPIVEK